MSISRPANERERLEALHSYHILDTESDEAFDNLCLLASRICETPIATISFLDENRQWFKSAIGINARETARDIAFCAQTILNKGLLVIPDTLQDDRFSGNPLVTSEPKIRFYAGAPLITPDDFPIGTMCVVDHVPRKLSASQIEALSILRGQVIMLLELGKRERELRDAAERQARVQRVLHETERRFFQFLDGVPTGIFVVDKEGSPYYANQAASQILGKGIDTRSDPEHLADTYKAFLEGTNQEYPADRMPVLRALKGETTMVEDMEIRRRDGTTQVQVWGAPVYDPEGSIQYAIVSFIDISDRKRIERRLRTLYVVNRILAEDCAPADAESRILRAISENLGMQLGYLWEVDAENNVLNLAHVWNSPSVVASEFEALSRQLKFSPGLGLPGAIWATAEPVWIPNVTEHSSFIRLPAALRNDLHGAFGFPIVSDKRVYGVMEFFGKQILQNDPELLSMLSSLGTQIGQFLARKSGQAPAT